MIGCIRHAYWREEKEGARALSEHECPYHAHARSASAAHGWLGIGIRVGVSGNGKD